MHITKLILIKKKFVTKEENSPMNEKYNKAYSLIYIILMVFVGLRLYLGIVIPNSYYSLAVNIIAFLVSIILTALVFNHEEEFDILTKVITPTISCLTSITVVITIFTLF